MSFEFKPAVREAAQDGPVLLVGHSMGGILSTAYAGMTPSAPLGALMAVSCTSVPRGVGLAAYRGVLRAVDRLPSRGLGLTRLILAATLPADTRGDFAAGGYALDAQDAALASLAHLDLRSAVRQLTVPEAMGERFQFIGFARDVELEHAFLAGDMSWRL